MILVVEDDKDMQALIRIALQDEGLELNVASDGREALEIIEAGELPNMVFLDSSMEGMSGAEFLRELETRFPDTEIPVVSLSGSDEPLRSPFVVAALRKPVDLDSFREFALQYAKRRPLRPA